MMLPHLSHKTSCDSLASAVTLVNDSGFSDTGSETETVGRPSTPPPSERFPPTFNVFCGNVYTAWPFQSSLGVDVRKGRPEVIYVKIPRNSTAFEHRLKRALGKRHDFQLDLIQYKLVVANEDHKEEIVKCVSEEIDVVMDSRILQDLITGDDAYELADERNVPALHRNLSCSALFGCGYIVRKANTEHQEEEFVAWVVYHSA
jgi:hypothetical protein